MSEPVMDREVRRRLAVLKVWVDAHGVHARDTFWKPGHEGPDFDPDRWLRDRSDGEFDEEDMLADPSARLPGTVLNPYVVDGLWSCGGPYRA